MRSTTTLKALLMIIATEWLCTCWAMLTLACVLCKSYGNNSGHGSRGMLRIWIAKVFKYLASCDEYEGNKAESQTQ